VLFLILGFICLEMLSNIRWMHKPQGYSPAFSITPAILLYFLSKPRHSQLQPSTRFRRAE